MRPYVTTFAARCECAVRQAILLSRLKVHLQIDRSGRLRPLPLTIIEAAGTCMGHGHTPFLLMICYDRSLLYTCQFPRRVRLLVVLVQGIGEAFR